MKTVKFAFALAVVTLIRGCAATEKPSQSASQSGAAVQVAGRMRNGCCCCPIAGRGRVATAAAVNGLPAAPAVASTQPFLGGRGAMAAGPMRGGRGMGRGPGSAMTPGRGRGAGMPAVMQPIHLLLAEHQKVMRTVKQIPGGVETVTTSDDAAVTELIRKYTRQMN